MLVLQSSFVIVPSAPFIQELSGLQWLPPLLHKWALNGAPVALPERSIAVSFEDDLSILIEGEKLQIAHQLRPAEPVHRYLIQDALELLAPFLRPFTFKAVGRNATAFVELEEPAQRLVSLFGPPPDCIPSDLRISRASGKFGFVRGSGALNVEFEPTVLQETAAFTGEAGREGIVVKANYHAEVSSGSVDELLELANELPSLVLDLDSVTTQLLAVRLV